MTSRDFRDRLVRRARRVEVALSPEVIRALEDYVRLLARWNEKINLTALAVSQLDDDAVDRLLVEPLVAVRFLPGGSAQVMDVGSGSGSPAIPMALASPGIKLRMVESKTRKAVFLTEACRHLGLASAQVETARFEQLLARPDLHESADVLTVRAVRVEPRVLLTFQAFLKPGGELFWFRGPVGPDEPVNVPPPLQWRLTSPLVDPRRGRLSILTKTLRPGR